MNIIYFVTYIKEDERKENTKVEDEKNKILKVCKFQILKI